MADGSTSAKPRSVIGFAGGGGSSVAFKLATGLDPDVANMVSPPPAAALIAANCADLIQPEHRRAAA